MNELPSRDDFAKYLNEEFALRAEEVSETKACLIKVSELSTRGVQSQFNLIFVVETDAKLEQMLYEVTHTHLGKLDLFLVPVERNENGLQMQAVFNQLNAE